MADPLSITASLLAIVTAAAQSSKSLYETVKRFKDRDKTLRRLQEELKDLIDILSLLTEAATTEQSVLTLLRGPVERCSQICREFEQTMATFGEKSKMGFRDWTKMEFMRGDIHTFIDTLAGYKSTISVGLGTITITHTSKISRQVLHDYTEMVKDTQYNLELRLQRIDESMTRLTMESQKAPRPSVNLEDEREVTRQCLRICEDARAYIDSLSNRQSILLEETAVEEESFEAQLRTRQALLDSRGNFTGTIGRLQERLDVLIQNNGPSKDKMRSQLQADIDVSKQCIDVCKIAGEVSQQKVYRIGEVIAEGDSDQVVVTTLADLFDIRKALSKDRSAQLVGSMDAGNLQLLTEKRYSSRFGTAAKSDAVNLSAFSNVHKRDQAPKPQPHNHEHFPGSGARQSKPSPNQTRKRFTDDAAHQEKDPTPDDE